MSFLEDGVILEVISIIRDPENAQWYEVKLQGKYASIDITLSLSRGEVPPIGTRIKLKEVPLEENEP